MGKVNPKTVWTICLLCAGAVALVYFAVPPSNFNGFPYLLAALLGAAISAFVIGQKSNAHSDGQGNSRLRALTDNLPIHIAEIGTDMRIKFINARFEKDLIKRMRLWKNLELDSVVGKKLDEIMQPDRFKRIATNIEQVMQGEIVSVEFELPSSDENGEPVVRSGSYVPKFGDQGGVEGFFILTEDISLRKRAEESLKSSELIYRSLTELLPLSLVVMLENKIVYCNAAAVELVGAKSEDDLLGRDFLDFVHPDHHELVKERRIERIQKGHIARAEYKQIRMDGSEFYTEVGGLSIPWQGGTAGLVLIRDITEQKKIDLMKTEFVSIVSHELRTPITSLKGALELIQGGVLGDVPEAMTEMIRIANQNTERLGSLVNDILDFEKLQSGKVAYDFKAQPLNSIVKSSMEINKTFAERFGVNFQYQSDGSNGIVLADDQRLSQVISNLLSNAVKFSPDGGKVGVLVEKREDFARVSVSDQGPGISDANRHLIFQRFSQADSSDTRSAGGTGLGLSISKAIIEDHNGQIDFVSEVGKGSVFYFDLPLEG